MTRHDRPKRHIPKTWTTAGPGRKFCPGCRVYIGNRTVTCAMCGHVFTVKKSPYKSAMNTRPPLSGGAGDGESREERQRRLPEISIPSGPPPAQLTGTGQAAVQIWMQDLADAHPNHRLAASAYRYWAKRFYAVGTVEYGTVCKHINAYAAHARRGK